MLARPYDTRKLSLGICTVGDLQQLARVMGVSEEELFVVIGTEATRAGKIE